MATIRELRLRAHLNVAALARLAGVDRKTVEKAERGDSIQDVKAYAIVDALNAELNQSFTVKDFPQLNIRQ